MLRKFLGNTTLQEEQDKLSSVLQRFVNVTNAKVDREDNKVVKEMLKDLDSFVLKFMLLKDKNPDKFISIIWPKDYSTNTHFQKKQKSLRTEKPQDTENRKHLALDTARQSAVLAEAEAEGLNKFLEAYTKIWRYAYRNNNEEITRFVVYHLHVMLEDMGSKPNNRLFVNGFLNCITSLAYESIQNTAISKDASIHSSALEWYNGIVLQSYNPEKRVKMEYIDTFDNALFTMLRFIVAKDRFDLFEFFVSTFSDSILITDDNEIWDIADFITTPREVSAERRDKHNRLIEKIRLLAELETHLTSVTEVYGWITRLDEIVTEIESDIIEDAKKAELHKLSERIKANAEAIFKYNNILEIVYMIGAYCVFENKSKYIKTLWEYKDPNDSDAMWAGEDIVPNNVSKIVRIYYKTDIRLSRFDFWNGHHGSTKYKQQYFLLLLARTINKMSFSCDQKIDLNIPTFNNFIYNNVENSVEALISLANELKGNTPLLNELGFSNQSINEIYDEKLPCLLRKFKTSAQEKIQTAEQAGNLSLDKIEQFKAKVAQKFDDAAQLRKLLKEYDLYEDKTDKEVISEPKRFGLSIVDQKAAFFQQWHIEYVNWPENYGQSLAAGEDALILNEILKKCEQLDTGQLDQALIKTQHMAMPIIIATTSAFYKIFNSLPNFKPNWKIQKNHDNRQYNGLYEFDNRKIPVYRILGHNLPESILILDAQKIGKLIQYSPLDSGEDNKFIYGKLYIQITAFSDDKDLIEKYISSPPQWLQKIGGEVDQRKHLLSSVLVRVFERFEFIKSENFSGWKVDLKKRN